jgi:hypothetical protein
MLGCIVEVSHEKRHLSIYRGFMLEHSKDEDRQETIGKCALTETYPEDHLEKIHKVFEECQVYK